MIAITETSVDSKSESHDYDLERTKSSVRQGANSEPETTWAYPSARTSRSSRGRPDDQSPWP
jgi:hypothetical protein